MPYRIYLPFSKVPHHTNGRVHTPAALLAQVYDNIRNILETQLLNKVCALWRTLPATQAIFLDQQFATLHCRGACPLLGLEIRDS